MERRPKAERLAAERIGLVAGSGRFPVLFAETARRRGVEVVAVAHLGETDPALERVVSAITWIHPGELDAMIHALQTAGIRRTVMVGGIAKPRLFRELRPDERATRLLARLDKLRDDLVLRALAAEFETEGIAVVESTLYLQEIVPVAGVLGIGFYWWLTAAPVISTVTAPAYTPNAENGEIVITKLPDAGGMVTAATVKEQLLYEIGDPENYLSPDATVSFLTLRGGLRQEFYEYNILDNCFTRGNFKLGQPLDVNCPPYDRAGPRLPSRRVTALGGRALMPAHPISFA